MKKYCVGILFLFFISCNYPFTIKVSFQDLSGFKPGNPVIMEKDTLGYIKAIKDTLAFLTIKSVHKENLKSGVNFYAVKMAGNPRIMVLPNPNHPLNFKKPVKGYPEYRYWLALGKKNLSKKIKDLREFYDSEEWKSFKKETSRKLKELMKKGEEYFNQHKKDVKKEMLIKIENIKKRFGEEAAKEAERYIDNYGN